MLIACIDRVLATLHTVSPEMGKIVAIDGSDLPAYANVQRYVSRGGALRERFSDPDATWVTAHRSPPAAAAATTAMRCTLPSAQRPAAAAVKGEDR